jgi:hypothetical protein
MKNGGKGKRSRMSWKNVDLSRFAQKMKFLFDQAIGRLSIETKRISK